MEGIINFLPTLITAVVSIGGVLAYVKKYFAPAKEVGELLVAVASALQDGKITQEELDFIVKEAKDIPAAVRAIRSK